MNWGSRMYVKCFHPDGERHVPKLIHLGDEPRPYGVTEQDTWNLDHYLANVMANGLRMLMSSSTHCWPQEMETIASKLEFYASNPAETCLEYIDFSKDEHRDFDDEKWLDFDGQPGFQEYCEKSRIIDEMRIVYLNEALDWLKDNWSGLWD
jgi:hypothetical protein